MFITADDSDSWLSGLDNETLQTVSISAGDLDGFNEAYAKLGGDLDIPQDWDDSLVWVVKKKTPGIIIVGAKGSDGHYQPQDLISLQKCIGYPWFPVSAVTDGTGYLVAMKAFMIVEVPSLTRIGTTSEGTYATKDSVAIFMHTSTDGFLGTHGRSATQAAAVKLTDIPTSF